MNRTKITLTLPVELSAKDEQQVGLLLRDALMDFVSLRNTPTPEGYVNRRYPHLIGEQRLAKIEQVVRRLSLACDLYGSEIEIRYEEIEQPMEEVVVPKTNPIIYLCSICNQPMTPIWKDDKQWHRCEHDGFEADFLHAHRYLKKQRN